MRAVSAPGFGFRHQATIEETVSKRADYNAKIVASGGHLRLNLPPLHERETARYLTEGYAVFRSVIDAALIAELRTHVEWLKQHSPANYANSELPQLHRMNDDPFWLRVVSDDRLLDVAEKFVGPNIALFNSSYFCKATKNGCPVLWHQDRSYWPIKSDVVTVWLAVDNSTQEEWLPSRHPRIAASDVEQAHREERHSEHARLGDGCRTGR